MGTAETRTHIQTHDAPGDATKEKRAATFIRPKKDWRRRSEGQRRHSGQTKEEDRHSEGEDERHSEEDAEPSQSQNESGAMPTHVLMSPTDPCDLLRHLER